MKSSVMTALLLGAAAMGLAQEGALPGAAKERQPRIAVVDMARVTGESLMGKGYSSKIEALNSEINAERTKKQAELQKMEAAVKALSDDLEKQQSLLSDEAIEKRRQEIVRKQREREAYIEDGQQDIQRMQQRAQVQAQALSNEFNQRIQPHIDAVVKERVIDILLDRGAIVYSSKDFDISRDVIVRADDAERAAQAKSTDKPAAAPAAAAPAAPTAPAAPKPQPKKP
jgi:Skp family chaperone for outer membrane proteins